MSKVIVIGTNHAGTHAVTTITDNYKDVEVTTYDKNNNISFLGCGMALWIGNVIDSGDGLFYATPESLREGGANVYMEHELVDVDFNAKKVFVKNLETNTIIEDSYDKLIIAVGSWPILPKLPGHDLENIIYAKIYQNAQNAIEKVKDPSINNVVVVGAGYIGVELAESFKQNGKNITLINNENVLNRYYDVPFQECMRECLEKNGVNCRIGETVKELIGENGRVTKVVTDKNTYDADLVLMSIGFKPNTDIFKDKNIELTANGAFKTNQRMETSISDVYAIGDCATVFNNASKKYQHIALATNAVRTGIVAAHSSCGTPLEMQGVQGSNAIHIFGLSLCSTGMTEMTARENGFNVSTVEVTDNLKPEFMPTNEKVTLKIVWDKDTRRILGAQMMSKADVSLAIHMFSMAVQEDYSIDKLALLDLFFLPHFNKPHNFITSAGLKALGK